MAAPCSLMRSGFLYVAAVLPAVAGGCGGGALINEQRLGDGLTIVLPGIDGAGPASDNICRTLTDLNVPTAIEVYNWTVPGGTIVNQCAMGRNRAVAGRLAEHIADYRRAYPRRPVYLIGHSGGTAIAVWAAEALPPGETLDGIFLMGSSLSPCYDLRGALAATRRLVNYYSASDSALLGAGCTAIGTMDRLHTEAAGMVGFSMVHRRLKQVPHDASMTAAGADGSHFSYCGTPFVTAYLAPHLARPATAVATVATASPTPGPTSRVLDPVMDTPPFASLRPQGVLVAAK